MQNRYCIDTYLLLRSRHILPFPAQQFTRLSDGHASQITRRVTLCKEESVWITLRFHAAVIVDWVEPLLFPGCLGLSEQLSSSNVCLLDF